MSEQSPSKKIITAAEVANYVVCPEAWRLKFFGLAARRQYEHDSAGQKLREEWSEKLALSNRLRYYTKIAWGLVVIIVVIVFFLDRRMSSSKHRHDAPLPPTPVSENAEAAP